MKIPKYSTHHLQRSANDFISLSSVNDFCYLLDTHPHQLMYTSQSPKYRAFEIDKKKGGKRQIEDPEKTLKEIQQTLNFYLQSVYYFQKTEASYGFIMSTKSNGDPRNIATNALKHTNKEWLLNIDFKDFFHSISAENIYTTFERTPFNFDQQLCSLLTGLTTYKGRLPMGAPTSPVLSNFACTLLDYDYLNIARTKQWTYTRFADDLSFSSEKPIIQSDIIELKKIAQIYGFKFNPDKIKLFGPQDTKIVTGLNVSDKVELPNGYLEYLYLEIDKLKNIEDVFSRMGSKQSDWIVTFKKHIRGLIEFARFVLGTHHPEYLNLILMFESSLDRESPHLPVSWLEFDYIY